MDCKNVRDELSALIDGELDNNEKEAILSHIAECEECRKEYEELQQLKKEFSKLDTQLRGALAEKALTEIYAEAYPKKKAPFFIRYVGTAAALLIILSVALYTRLTPANEADKNASAESVKVTLDSTGTVTDDGNYVYTTQDAIEESVTVKAESFKEYSDTVNGSVSTEAPFEPEAVMPEAPCEPEAVMPETPFEPEETRKPQASMTPPSFRVSNSVPTNVAIIVVDCEMSEITPLFSDIESVESNVMTLDTHHEEVIDVLYSNSISITHTDLPKESESTSIWVIK